MKIDLSIESTTLGNVHVQSPVFENVERPEEIELELITQLLFETLAKVKAAYSIPDHLFNLD